MAYAVRACGRDPRRGGDRPAMGRRSPSGRGGQAGRGSRAAHQNRLGAQGCRGRDGRGRWRRLGWRGRRRQEVEWISVCVLRARLANAEVEVRSFGGASAAGTDGPEAIARDHVLALRYLLVGQMQVGGDELAVRGRYRDRQPVIARCARESHRSANRRHDGLLDARADVDAPVLPRRVWIRPVAIGGDHVPRDRPPPRFCMRGRRRRQDERDCEEEGFAHGGDGKRAALARGLGVAEL